MVVGSESKFLRTIYLSMQKHFLIMIFLLPSLDCPTSAVLKCFEKAPVFHLLLNEWKIFSKGLNTASLKEKLLEDGLKLRNKGLLDVLEELLDDWQIRKSHDAKLSTLQDILINTCGWIDIAGKKWKI